jgi:hypothetical protein
LRAVVNGRNRGAPETIHAVGSHSSGPADPEISITRRPGTYGKDNDSPPPSTGTLPPGIPKACPMWLVVASASAASSPSAPRTSSSRTAIWRVGRSLALARYAIRPAEQDARRATCRSDRPRIAISSDSFPPNRKSPAVTWLASSAADVTALDGIMPPSAGWDMLDHLLRNLPVTGAEVPGMPCVKNTRPQGVALRDDC